MKILHITILAAVLSACSAETGSNANLANAAPEPVPSRTALPPVTPTPAPAAARADEDATGQAADFEGTAGNTEKKNPRASGAALMKDVRAARHEGFDRVVFEFEGAELPSYKIEYIDKPVRSCGSGEVVPFAGDAWLEVRFTGANAHDESGEPSVKDRVRSPNLTIVKDLKLTCDFEAEVEWVLGAAAPNKYRILELKNPSRLVVDIKHAR